MSTNESRRKITISIAGREYTTRDDDQEAASLLRLAGFDPDLYDLARVKRNGEYRVFKDERVIDLEDGDSFIVVKQTAPVA